MKTLVFADRLTENPFAYSNHYDYSNPIGMGIFFKQDSPVYPFILKGKLLTIALNKWELEYCSPVRQLGGRTLTAKKIKEVMNSSRMPLIFSVKGRNYLIGKGFLSTFNHDPQKIELLFVATVKASITISSIDQVSFFISKSIYLEEHKAFHGVIKEIIAEHPGDVTICKNISEYVGEKIPLPKGGTLAEMQQSKDRLLRIFIEGALNPRKVSGLVTEEAAVLSSLPVEPIDTFDTFDHWEEESDEEEEEEDIDEEEEDTQYNTPGNTELPF